LFLFLLQVDLRGFLGERSWLRALLDALGWVDAYVERMLMAVILVKDEVRGLGSGTLYTREHKVLACLGTCVV
jgi:hypothetical protein